jgi:thiosulfate/3-mercaptopyruvate sulfurtransferase
MVTLVSADWVEERLDVPEFLVIDTRFSMRHLMGHLKSAVNVPPPKLRDSEGKLLSSEGLAQLFGAAGLGDEVAPVLYDGYDGRNSAMVAWILEYLGRDDVYLMDVVYDEWKAQGREVLYRPVPRVARQFTSQVKPQIRASLSDITNEAALGLPKLKLVDTRSREEYAGEAETGENPGHIPGAVHIDWRELVGEDGRLLCSEAKVRQLLAGAGVEQTDRVVAYCQVGARAALGYLALKRFGYDVRLYDASYAEWSGSGMPVEK